MEVKEGGYYLSFHESVILTFFCTINFGLQITYMSSFTHTGTVDLSSCSKSCTPMPDCGGQPSPSVDSFCCVVTDLTPGTNYTVDVVAISEAGIGEISDQQVQQTDASSELLHSPVL